MRYRQADSREQVTFKYQIYRSFLYCSGNNFNQFEKAISSKADAISIDLEDSVPTGLKKRVCH